MTKDKTSYTTYSNPLTTRYASEEMAYIFSPQMKFKTWRELWIALAEAEKQLGLKITDAQIKEMQKYVNDINFEEAEAREKEVRHDVMSHVYAFGLKAKKAAPIIHLGATSAYVGDNTDIIQMREALLILSKKLAWLIAELSKFALKYKDMPTLGFTHFQPAQLTTVGKRASLWIQDFYFDLLEVNFMIDTLPLLGVKGTTGTQASFMELFGNDEKKVKKLEELVVKKMGFKSAVKVSGQTYTRKIDSRVIDVLSGIAQSASKMATDIRLLQNLNEIEEPFEKNQIGSSAMAYKRNPMRSERVCSLARCILGFATVPPITEATQWFERTLDDSASKRIVIPEAFMAADAIVDILRNVADGLVVYPKVISARIMSVMPFMITENIIMRGVEKGGDRQELHEVIRKHSMEAAKTVKLKGKPNDLLERIISDPEIEVNAEDIDALMDPALYTGRSASQVVEFLEEIMPLVKKCGRGKIEKVELKV